MRKPTWWFVLGAAYNGEYVWITTYNGCNSMILNHKLMGFHGTVSSKSIINGPLFNTKASFLLHGWEELSLSLRILQSWCLLRKNGRTYYYFWKFSKLWKNACKNRGNKLKPICTKQHFIQLSQYLINKSSHVYCP